MCLNQPSLKLLLTFLRLCLCFAFIFQSAPNSVILAKVKPSTFCHQTLYVHLFILAYYSMKRFPGKSIYFLP